MRSRDTYSNTVRYADRQIVASSNDRKKRDQLHHNLIQQYLPGFIPDTVPEIICELGDPYDTKPGLGGMTAYPPNAMTAVCIMFEAERATYMPNI